MIVLFALHAAALPRALLNKHRSKDRDTLIEQLFICIYQQINGSAIYSKKLTSKKTKKIKI